MEVLLLQDINGIGKKNDLLLVGDGYALNFLLPRRAALVATPLVRKRYADLIRRRAEERENEKSAQTNAVKAVAGKSVTFIRKVTKTGKLYAAINESAIVEALKAQLSMELPEDAILLDEPIKTTGSHAVQLKIADQTVNLNVVVEAEKADKKKD
jgi:large subunit ribosomal protein L9